MNNVTMLTVVAGIAVLGVVVFFLWRRVRNLQKAIAARDQLDEMASRPPDPSPPAPGLTLLKGGAALIIGMATTAGAVVRENKAATIALLAGVAVAITVFSTLGPNGQQRTPMAGPGHPPAAEPPAPPTTTTTSAPTPTSEPASPTPDEDQPTTRAAPSAPGAPTADATAERAAPPRAAPSSPRPDDPTSPPSEPPDESSCSLIHVDGPILDLCVLPEGGSGGLYEGSLDSPLAFTGWDGEDGPERQGDPGAELPMGEGEALVGLLVGP